MVWPFTLLLALITIQPGARQWSSDREAPAPPRLNQQHSVTTIETDQPLPSSGRLGGVAVGPDGSIYVSNFREAVWRISAFGEVTALVSDLRGSSGNAVAPDGSLLQASFLDNRIVRIAPDGSVTTLAKGLNGPVGIAVAPDGVAYVCNCRGNSISRIGPEGEVSEFARSELFACPNGITVDTDGSLIVASFNSPVLARVSPTGEVARHVEVPDGGNAHLARIGDDLFVTKIAANKVYRVGADGAVERVAGTGELGLEDGPALEALLARPNGIAATPAGDALVLNNLAGEWRGDDPTRIVLRRIDLAPPGSGQTLETQVPERRQARQATAGDAHHPKASQMDLDQIRIRSGEMEFEAWAAGHEEGPLVILLHGFPQTGYSFRHQLRALAGRGYRAIAPDQRGYSPGARPAGIEPYAIGHLVEDVVGIVRALGRSRFHLVGHDWGGAVAWVTATRHPDMVETLTVLSTPHFAAFRRFLAEPESEQAQRSSYFQDFAAPGAEDRFLANDKAFFRSLFRGLDVPESDLQVYLDRLGTPAAMRAALNWYSAALRPPPGALGAGPTQGGANAGANAGGEGRAAAGGVVPAPSPIRVPTLYVWGTKDVAFSREAAELTREFVAAPYRFVALEGQGHWLPESAAKTVTGLLLEHLRGP